MNPEPSPTISELRTPISDLPSPNSHLPFSFYPGQLDYLARVATKDYGLIAADTGCGKSLMAITLIRMKLGASAISQLPTPISQPPSPISDLNGRALIIAPQGTLRTKAGVVDEEGDGEADPAVSPGMTPSQWMQEIRKFAPGLPVHQLFSWDDYEGLVRKHGGFPTGIFVTYYEAYFRNQARETLPDSWDHKKLCKAFEAKLGPSYRKFLVASAKAPHVGAEWYHENALFAECDPDGKVKRWKHDPKKVKVGEVVDEFMVADPEDYVGWTVQEIVEHPLHDYSQGVGVERNGIRCVVLPCLATRIDMAEALRRRSMPSGNGAPYGSSAFDFVALDEAHTCTNLDAQVTQSLIRVQARFRFAFTATPIPNIVSNLFSLMGWLCVPGWYRNGEGGVPARNAAWPYAREEIQRFNDTFLSVERDYTQEQMNLLFRDNWRGKCVKASPVISSPARLLKLLKPSLAFISKPMCRESYQAPKVVDVRVGLGQEQMTLYRHYMNRSNIPGRHPLVRARKQIAWLRGITADPTGFAHGGPRVGSNFNPKTVAILELVADILRRGEQVTIITARVGQTDTLHRLLGDALGDPRLIARIDSTHTADHHSGEAERFKKGKARVLLMGIKCAASHSFSRCPNAIIASLEYSYGPFHQAKGRVDRVNSEFPVTIYCILHRGTIEETMFDVVATKQDAATICLHGQRVPRDFKPVDMQEILAESMTATEAEGDATGPAEDDLEARWPELRERLKVSLVQPPTPISHLQSPRSQTPDPKSENLDPIPPGNWFRQRMLRKAA